MGRGQGSNTSAQIFYLYDEPCGGGGGDDDDEGGERRIRLLTGSHNSRNTAQISGSASSNSTCGNTDEMKRPDAMGTQPTPGNSSTPIYEYSADLAGDYLGGLAMMRKGSTCRTSYTSSEAPATVSTPSTTGYKYAVHAWTTSEFDDTFRLNGRATVSVWTQTLGGQSGRGFLVRDADRAPRERRRPLGHHDCLDHLRRLPLPSTPRRLSFTFTVSPQVNIEEDNQLALVLHLRQESAQDIALLYDHPLYEVAARGRDLDPDLRLT